MFQLVQSTILLVIESYEGISVFRLYGAKMHSRWLTMGKYLFLISILLWCSIVVKLAFNGKGSANPNGIGEAPIALKYTAEGNSQRINALKNVRRWDHDSLELSEPRYHQKKGQIKRSRTVSFALQPRLLKVGSSSGIATVSIPIKDSDFGKRNNKADYSVDLSEYDIMPMTGLKVPKFWKPDAGVAFKDIGSKVDGKETIFVMIASYRDFQCRETIASMFSRADHPERIFVGAADQIVDGDIGCVTLPKSCEEDPEQMLCKHKDQITVFEMDAKLATGPVTARHIGDRLYKGEYFTMQLDAHCEFARHWDTNIINQWRQTGNEMAVLTSYLSDVQGSIDKNGDSTRHTRPIMCNSDFEGAMPARYLRHGSQPEDSPSIRDMPQLEPYWAAGFSFSRGHFTVQVPYDGYQPMVFQGEEIGISVRAFTHGYDFYAPRDSVVFHEYAVKSSRRKKVHMYWENSQLHVGEGKKSLARGMSIIKMAPDIEDSKWDHSDIDRYGLGTVRPLDLYYKLFLIDTKKRSAVQLCPFVRPGRMHKDFQRFLREDGMGIDYTHLLDYDTAAVLSDILEAQRPGVETQLKKAISNKNKQSLEYLLGEAVKVKIDSKNPTLYNEARSTLEKLSAQ